MMASAYNALPDLLARTAAAGVELTVRAGRLAARPRERITPELLNGLKQYRAELLALLEPKRDPDQLEGCPPAWRKLPILPEKGSSAATTSPDGSGLTYRVRLYGHHYRLTFRPRIRPEQVRAERDDGLTWEAPSLAHLQRLTWLERIRAVTLPGQTTQNGEAS